MQGKRGNRDTLPTPDPEVQAQHRFHRQAHRHLERQDTSVSGPRVETDFECLLEHVLMYKFP